MRFLLSLGRKAPHRQIKTVHFLQGDAEPKVCSLRSDCTFVGLHLLSRDSSLSGVTRIFLKSDTWLLFYYKAFIKKKTKTKTKEQTNKKNEQKPKCSAHLTQTGMTKKKKKLVVSIFGKGCALLFKKNGYINAHFNNWHKIPLTG